MNLVIAEKPQVASAIAEAIGHAKKEKGYIKCNDFYITWCVGHLLSIKFKMEDTPWSWDTLPLKADGWTFEPNKNTIDQYNIVTDLVKKANTIINAGDPDEEGQLIVDSILYKNGIIDLKGKSTKTIKRILINDFNTDVIAKQLQQLKDNNDYLNLSLAAIARQIADKIFGYNLTRAYTLKNKELGNSNVISIGRVQTPMLALIVRRDEEVKKHVKSYFFKIKGAWNGINNFLYKPKENEVDENKRITSESVANDILQRMINNKDKAVIAKYEQKEEIDNVPLPYNLLDLQIDCSKIYNMKADPVTHITQSLREKHKAITYNRSDCNYLLDETYEESPAIINKLQGFTDPVLERIINNADVTIKSKAFNSSKTSAHTAIIPTQSNVDFSAFSEDEKKVYSLIARRFTMQFLPPAKYKRHSITINIGDDVLEHSHRQLIEAGWKGILIINDDEESIPGLDYSQIKEGMNIDNIDLAISKEETKPKKLYTTDTFLNDLKKVAIYCKDEKIKAILKEKDKDKAGEHGGIGTPATRSAIIKNLYDRGYITDDKKNVVSTKLGKDLIAALSETITYPDMTALWHEEIKEIGQSFEAVKTFTDNVTAFSSTEIDNIKNNKLNVEVSAELCPKCNSPLKRLKSKQGSFFWLCLNEKCSKTYPDKNNKPDFTVKSKAAISEVYKCMLCGKGLKRLESKNKKGSYFWACSNYPECKNIYQDKDGKPVYDK